MGGQFLEGAGAAINFKVCVRWSKFHEQRSRLHQPNKTAAQRQQTDSRDRPDRKAMPAREFLRAIKKTRRRSQNRFIGEMASEVQRELVCGAVAPVAILFQTLHHDAIEIAAQEMT